MVIVSASLSKSAATPMPIGFLACGRNGSATLVAVDGVLGLTTADIGVVFQPIVDIASGRAIAHEALVRCKRQEYASPPVLFDFAVREDACGKLGRLIREVAFDTSGDVALFVNLHPAELTARWLIQPDDPIGYHAKEVFLEITETATFTHFDLCRSVLKEVCERTGALLVIDDFGAGHSNLERVVHLEPAVVKLDLSLTRRVQEHPRKQIVVRHMVNLCRELGARVVAEGVETLDELKCVRDLGVDFAQGYLLARPAAPPPDHTWPFSRSTARAPVTVAPPRSRGVSPPSKRPPVRQSRRPAK
jgi:EAL domain-containing protein (putative c-di-GMP-specific phosphodiesterase class I)